MKCKTGKYFSSEKLDFQITFYLWQAYRPQWDTKTLSHTLSLPAWQDEVCQTRHTDQLLVHDLNNELSQSPSTPFSFLFFLLSPSSSFSFLSSFLSPFSWKHFQTLSLHLLTIERRRGGGIIFVKKVKISSKEYIYETLIATLSNPAMNLSWLGSNSN